MFIRKRLIDLWIHNPPHIHSSGHLPIAGLKTCTAEDATHEAYIIYATELYIIYIYNN